VRTKLDEVAVEKGSQEMGSGDLSGAAPGSLAALCSAACQLAPARWAAIFAIPRGWPRALASSSASALERERMKRMLRRDGALRHALRSGLCVREHGLRFFPVKQHGVVAAVLGVAPIPGKVLGVGVLAQLAELAGAVMERSEQDAARAEARRQLARTQAEIQLAQQRVDTTLSSAASELKVPLAAMKGYLDMVARGMAGPLSPTLQHYIDRLRQAVERERDLIGRWLTPARDARCDLRDTLREVVEQIAPAVRRSDVAVSMEVPQEPCWFRGDATPTGLLSRQLSRALLSTIAPGSAVELHLEARDGEWLISVKTDKRGRAWTRAIAVLDELLRRHGGHLVVPEEQDVMLQLAIPSAWHRSVTRPLAPEATPRTRPALQLRACGSIDATAMGAGAA
jgi:two-component system, OmpR family, sensor kinase